MQSATRLDLHPHLRERLYTHFQPQSCFKSSDTNLISLNTSDGCPCGDGAEVEQTEEMGRCSPSVGREVAKKGTGAAQSFMKCAEKMGVLPLSRQPGN